MILVPKHKVEKSEEFKAFVRKHPGKVYVQDGRIVPNGEKWEGYVDTIPYKHSVLTHHGGKSFAFTKKMDGTYEVL